MKLAVFPAVTVWLDGCEVMDGATGAANTVSIAALLVTVPAESLTATVNAAPLSEVVVGGVVYDGALAPLMAAPFFFH